MVVPVKARFRDTEQENLAMTRLSITRLLSLPAVAGLAGAMMVAGPAVAGSAAAAPSFGPHAWGGPHTNAGNWGGYAATGSGFKKITGTWKEPVAKCKASHDLYAPWLGLDGYGDQTVEQTGVQTACNSGHPVDSGWYEMYPAAPVYYSNPVSTGDTIRATVVFAGGNSYSLTLQDVTKGWSHTVHKNLSAKNASAEAIIEAPGGFPGLPNGVTFSNVTVNGKKLSAFHPAKLVATGGWTPGPLNGGTFTIKHK
jgi:peptidase A4-like protein